MKKLIVVSILIIFATLVKSQNLVINPSFEDNIFLNIDTPCFNIPCCLYAQPNSWTYANQVFFPDLNGNVHYCTCDMNFCTNSEYPIPYQGVPVNNWNGAFYTINGYYYQEAMDGCAYLLLGTYCHHNINIRQYPMVKFTDSLVIGRKYCLSFWISVPDLWYYMTSNTIGAYFSTGAPVAVDWKVINVNPQIENMKTDYPDTSNTWYLVSGSFVADSNYQYLTIGNFYPDSLTNVLVDSANMLNISCFGLYLDMVALYDCTGHNYSANAGNDTLICIGDTILIGTDDEHNRQYFWSPGSLFADSTAAKQLVSPVVTTTYYLHVIDEFFLESWDTITVFVEECFPDSVEIVECNIWVPNSFTPNRDGLNDELCVIGEGIEKMSLVIFNRRSEVVFETKDPYRCWDGTYNGRLAPQGVYVYLLSATLADGTTVNRDGVVMLIR